MTRKEPPVTTPDDQDGQRDGSFFASLPFAVIVSLVFWAIICAGAMGLPR